MLRSSGSADCAVPSGDGAASSPPSVDEWLSIAKASPDAARIGMYLVHSGVVRADARSKVRDGDVSAPEVTGLMLSHDSAKLDAAIADARSMPGIYCIKVWIANGRLNVGDDMMRVLVGGDIRPHVSEALLYLVGRIKNECVEEKELF
ncbi:MAG: molybdenum cofactor biosynthesis protein MoaE [Oscillospiraceae bacterium]|nr:molybdenum cofactor biosynthesis protein MoaE [Oscillospiraceae bacterium]